MKQEVLDTPEAKFNIDQEVLWHNRPDATNIKWVDAKVKSKNWDSDKESWVYHLETEKHGKSYFILFAKEEQLKIKKESQ